MNRSRFYARSRMGLGAVARRYGPATTPTGFVRGNPFAVERRFQLGSRRSANTTSSGS